MPKVEWPDFDNLRKRYVTHRPFVVSPPPAPVPEPVPEPPPATLWPLAAELLATPLPLPAAPPLPAGSILGTALETGKPVVLEETERQKGLYILGKTGFGKSTLMQHLILQDALAGHGVCVIDPHGKLITDVLATLPPKVDASRILLLDPADWHYPFGLNLYECADPGNPAASSQATSYVMGIFKKLWGDDGLHPSWGPQLEDLLSHLTQTFVQAQGYTIVDVPAFLERPAFRDKVLADVDPELQEYWQNTYTPRQDNLTYRTSTLNKVRVFTDNKMLRPILGQSRSTIDLAEIMNRGQILLVKLSLTTIGDEAVSLLGSLVVSQILRAMFSRPPQEDGEYRPFSLYCDEYRYFATADFARFFTEGRKFALKTVVAHQDRSQLDRMSQSTTLSVPNKVVFQVNPADAQELRREFHYVPPQAKTPVVKDPIAALQAKRHANHMVDYVSDWLRPLAESLEEKAKLEKQTSLRAYYAFAYSRETTEKDRQAYRLITQYLVRAMDGTLALRTRQDITYLVNIGFNMAHRMGLGGIYVAIDGEEKTAEYQHDLFIHLSNAVLSLLEPTPDDYWKRLQEFQERWQRQYSERLKVFLSDLSAAAQVLAAAPLYETSVYGAEPVAASEADTVGLLTHLPVGQARARIHVAGRVIEHTIQTRDTPQRQPRAQVAILVQTVSHQTRQQHAKPLAEVEQEIRRRQDTGQTGGGRTPSHRSRPMPPPQVL